MPVPGVGDRIRISPNLVGRIVGLEEGRYRVEWIRARGAMHVPKSRAFPRPEVVEAEWQDWSQGIYWRTKRAIGSWENPPETPGKTQPKPWTPYTGNA